MLLKKCKYHNNHQTACSLMIDDLIPAAVTSDGKPGPHNDWGYLMDQPNSLFSYFQRFLLSKFPEIKGTFFVPLESQYGISEENGYAVFKKDMSEEFIEFIKRQANEFELAFHGIRHTYKKDNTRFFEFENSSREDFATYKNKIDVYTNMGVEFSGGKFPGYRFNETAIEFIQFMNYKWFALDAGMINKKSPGNKPGYINNTNIVNIPTNLAGDVFNKKPKKTGFLKRSIKRTLFPGRYIKPEEYLEYLYIHGYPITIQEHFQNQRTDGKRQTPNIYDDIYSLDQIFGLLRPWDIWYATCSEVAHYYDSYINTDIVEKKNGEFDIRYQGNWDRLFLSFESDKQIIKEVITGQPIQGVAKNGRYVFNDLHAGRSYSCHSA